MIGEPLMTVIASAQLQILTMTSISPDPGPESDSLLNCDSLKTDLKRPLESSLTPCRCEINIISVSLQNVPGHTRTHRTSSGPDDV